MAVKAIIFDLDGTLIDTNTLHVEAWRRAFERFGFTITPDRIAPEIAHDGQEIIIAILGDSVAERQGEAIKEALAEAVPQVIEERKPLPVFAGARELFAALRERDIKTAIATAAGDEELDTLIEGSGFDVRELADEVTTKDDAESGKPAPDIVTAARKKLKLDAAECVFIGDTKWDALSARNAGIVALGVLEGSAFDETELLNAGMSMVFPTLAAVLENLDAILEDCG